MKDLINSKFLLIIALLITILSLSFPVYAKYSGGTGEPNDPYQIAMAEDLMLLGESPEDYDKHFILTADIDLDPNLPGRKVFDKAIIAPDRSGWGFKGSSFTGVFDGNGHIICNLTISGYGYLGFFGRLESEAKVKNLGLIDIKINDSGRTVGGLVAWNEGDVTDCYSIGTVSGSGWASSVGGLVGYNRSGNIIRCYSGGAVSGEFDVGGLVGENEGDLTNCYSNSTISCVESHGAGGLVGHNGLRGTVTHCYATGDVSGHDNVGGLGGNNVGVVTACYSIGTVTGDDHVGGLVGHNPGIVIHCFSNGTVSGKDYVGGLVGYNNRSGNIIRCYSGGAVSGEWDVGGLVGRNRGGEVAYCFWDTQTSGQTKSAGGIGLITPEMQITATFLEAGWDFVDETVNGTYDIWWILEGQDYPRLREFPKGLQFQPFPAICPYPKDGAIDIGQPLILKWVPGTPTLQHDVYLGEDEQAVTNATTISSGIYCGRQEAQHSTYITSILEWVTTYYWRIDEVDENDPNKPFKGNVWSFTSGEFLVVDDFESYNDLDEGQPGSNRIYLTWIDGFDNPNNGSIVGKLFIPFAEWMIAHTGKQSMPYSYDNSGPANYSEATANIDNMVVGRDWTIGGVGILSLWFRGYSNNAAEPMYVALDNDNGISGIVYNDNPNAAQLNAWTEWTIVLQDFADHGVDLTHVDSITIGFGNRNNFVAGGEGEMWFDDIRLYRHTEPEPEL